MPARFYDSTDPINVENLGILIYGQPGSRKSSLCQTAEKPFTLAFDPGIYRSHGRKGAMMFDSWLDVVQLDKDRDALLSGDWMGADPNYSAGVRQYAEAKTVILDTAGMGLSLLAKQIVAENVKHGSRTGGLSLQGYGVLKNSFRQWAELIKSRKQDVVFVCHEDEVKRGDEQYFQPSIVGGSYDTVMELADMAGRMHFENGKRVIDFYPSDRWMAKTPPCNWTNAMVLPEFSKEPDYFAKLIAQAKASMGAIANASASQAVVVKEWDDWSEKATIDEVNAFLISSKYTGMQEPTKSIVRKMVWEKVTKAGYQWNADGKFFFMPTQEAPA